MPLMCEGGGPPADSHVLVQLWPADVGEIEGKQKLPRTHIQHAVLLAQENRRVIEDPGS